MCDRKLTTGLHEAQPPTDALNFVMAAPQRGNAFHPVLLMKTRLCPQMISSQKIFFSSILNALTLTPCSTLDTSPLSPHKCMGCLYFIP